MHRSKFAMTVLAAVSCAFAIADSSRAQNADIAYASGVELGGTPTHPAPTRFAYHMTADTFSYATGSVPGIGGSPPCILAWKFSTNGSVVWTKVICPTGTVDSYGVAVTADSAYVWLAAVIDDGTDKDIAVYRLDAFSGDVVGSPLVYDFGVKGDDVPVRITYNLENQGTTPYVYVAGTSYGVDPLTGNHAGLDFILLKIAAYSMTSMTWATGWQDGSGNPIAARYDGPAHSDDTVADMAMLEGDGGASALSGYVYLTGPSIGTTTGTDFATVRVKKTNPTVVTAVRYATQATEVATSIAVGGNSVFVTGYGKTSGTGSSGTIDFLTFGYDMGLTPLWTATPYDAGFGGVDKARVIAYSYTPTAGEFLYVTGESYQGVATGDDVVLIRLNPANGNRFWTDQNGVRIFDNLSAHLEDRPTDMLIDKCGNAYIGGLTRNTGSQDYLAVSYRTSGALRWHETGTGNQFVSHDFSGTGVDAAAAIKVFPGSDGIEHNGDVFLFGSIVASGPVNKYGLIRYTQTGPGDCQ